MTEAFDKDYWDQIWTGDRATAMSTNAPNPHLMAEVGGLEPGTALEAGCGAGAEAIWLATQGWKVTAADVADAALAFAEERATAAGVGTLLIVGHLHDHSSGGDHGHGHGHGAVSATGRGFGDGSSRHGAPGPSPLGGRHR